MGLFPKYSIGDWFIAYIHNPTLDEDVEHLFKVERRELRREGLFKVEWRYRGNFYSVVNANPLQLEYSTHATGVHEKDIDRYFYHRSGFILFVLKSCDSV